MIVHLAEYVNSGDTPEQLLIQAVNDMAAGGLLVLSGITYVITANLTIGSKIGLLLDAGAQLAPQVGVTLTVAGPVIALSSSIIGGAGTVTLSKGKIDLSGAGPLIGGAVGLGAVGDTVGFYGATPSARAVALTVVDSSVVGATYDTNAQNVINNTRTRLNDLESRLKTYGLLP